MSDFSFDNDMAPAAGRNGRAAVLPASKRAVRKGESEAEELHPPVRLNGLEIIGYKRIRAVQYQLEPEGLTIIGGRNGAGKSSNLEAIECLLGGGKHIPDVPVRDGDPRATIVAQLQDASGRRYTVRRVINPDRTGGLEITREDGTTVGRAQEFLDAMKGVLWFDPPAFLRQPAKEQAETLRRLVGLDFSTLDRERATIYEQRTLIGRDRDRARGHAESLPFHADAPEEEQTSSDLAAAMTAAVEKNRTLDGKRLKAQQGRAHLASLERAASDAGADCERIREQIRNLQEQLVLREASELEAEQKLHDFRPKLAAFEEALAGQSEIDVSEIAARLTDVEKANRQVRENAARLKAFADADVFAYEYDALTEQIAAVDAEKRRQLAEVQMPVNGLGFDDAGLTVQYGGFPLSQASGAEQMHVAVAMAMLMSGGLKVCLIDAGEQLDLVQLALLDTTVRELGGQCLVARVSDGDECHIIIENGSIMEERVPA